AVVLDGGLARDLGAGGAGSLAVGIDVVDVHAQRLGVDPFDRARRRAERALRRLAGRADHDEPFSEGQLRVLDAPALALDLEPHLEAESAAQPVDGPAASS